MKKVAEIISLVLNPIFLILLLILLGIEKSNLSQSEMLIFTVSVLILNGLLPICFIYYFAKKGLILDDVLDNKAVLKNRPFLLAGGIIILFLETLTLDIFNNPEPLFTILLTLLFLIFALFLITLYRKISLHMALASTFSLVILFLFGYSFWPILLTVPAVLWSRLVLKRHTFKQILAALLLAILVAGLVFYSRGYIPVS
jgi:membrane-associated phospholipid phosphatase